MYNIGDKVYLKDIDRCLSPVNSFMYLDPPIDVEGTIKEMARFVDKQVCIEFDINFQKHTIWKYEFELPIKS